MATPADFRYARFRVVTPSKNVFVQTWQEMTEDGENPIEKMVVAVDRCLAGHLTSVRFTDRAGNIQIIPREILEQSNIKIETSRLGW